MNTSLNVTRLLLGIALWMGFAASPGAADGQIVREPGSLPGADPVVITVDEAIQIALVGNYSLRNTRLEVDDAAAQVRQAWGQVMPQVNLNSSYTRNLKSANPFAGSQAGGFFSSFGFIDWLAYNERARTDTDPSSVPISFGEFADRQQAGMEQAGIRMDTGDNPFSVPNQFTNGISIEQTLFSGSAFAAIAGAERLKLVNQRNLDRQEQLLISQVKQAFFQALLAAEQADVSVQSVSRTRSTLEEATRRVAQGVAPKFQRLSAEVELANLETQLVQVQNQASLALDNLKLVLGIPMEHAIRLRGDLTEAERGQYLTVAADEALAMAFRQRPDLEQARLAVELRRIDRNITRSQYYPTVSTFANLNYIGNVPDNRSNILSDPSDPFRFSQEQYGFFSSNYWNPSVNVGFRLSWNLFNGFQTAAAVQQKQIAIEQAENDAAFLEQNVRLEVEQALRNLRAAHQRIVSQEANVERAELNYEYAQARLVEGVASSLEERNASEQLDLSRLNYLQAVHDYLVARSAFETAVGMPLGQIRETTLTSN